MEKKIIWRVGEVFKLFFADPADIPADCDKKTPFLCVRDVCGAFFIF